MKELKVGSDVGKIYEKSGMGARVGFGKRPAVLVVDFSKGFTDPDSPLASDLSAPIDATARLLRIARQRQVPIIFTTEGYEPNMKDAGIWPKKIASQKYLILGTKFIEIDERLQPGDEDTIILKKGASAFFGTNLISILVTRSVDTVLVAGTSTSGCVRASVVDSMQYGFHTIVVEECVGDRIVGPHEASLFDMDAKYADVVSLEEAELYLKSLTSP